MKYKSQYGGHDDNFRKNRTFPCEDLCTSVAADTPSRSNLQYLFIHAVAEVPDLLSDLHTSIEANPTDPKRGDENQRSCTSVPPENPIPCTYVADNPHPCVSIADEDAKPNPNPCTSIADNDANPNADRCTSVATALICASSSNSAHDHIHRASSFNATCTSIGGR